MHLLLASGHYFHCNYFFSSLSLLITIRFLYWLIWFAENTQFLIMDWTEYWSLWYDLLKWTTGEFSFIWYNFQLSFAPWKLRTVGGSVLYIMCSVWYIIYMWYVFNIISVLPYIPIMPHESATTTSAALSAESFDCATKGCCDIVSFHSFFFNFSGMCCSVYGFYFCFYFYF